MVTRPTSHNENSKNQKVIAHFDFCCFRCVMCRHYTLFQTVKFFPLIFDNNNNNNNNNNKVIYTAQFRQGCKCAFSRQF